MKNKKIQAPKNQGKKVKRKSNFFRFISKLMPYILAISFVVTLFSLVGIAAGFGSKYSGFLKGCLSNFASWFVPVFMLYHSLMWYHDTKRKICGRRIFCSLLIVSLVASLQQVIEGSKNPEYLTYAAKTLYGNGVSGHGGGVVGGLIGTFLMKFGKPAALAVILILLLFMFLQMFNVTPASMLRAVFGKNKKKKKKAPSGQERTPLSARRHKFNVFDDDDDDINEDNIETLETDPAISDESITLDIERKKVKDEPRHISARPVVSHSQIQPYDSTKTYKPEESAVKPEPVQEIKPSPVKDADEFEKSTEFILTRRTYQDPVFEDTDETDAGYFEDTNENYDEEIVESSETHDDFSNYISKEALDKIAPKKEEELPVEKKSLFGAKKPVKEETPVSKPEPPKKEKKPTKKYVFPSLDFLKVGKSNEDSDAIREELQENARIIVETLNSFNAKTKIVDITRGPTVTRYELLPEAGVRVRSIANLVDDIALNLAAEGVRIESPIPGKSAVGIEVPNKITSFVYLKDLLEDSKFKVAKSKLTCALGKSIAGENIYIDIEKMPHLLVAGATGMGKSVCINSLLVSLLYKASPDDVRLILIDPKRVELSNYNGIPHLLVPVVCEPKKSLGTLQWAVSEMERRFTVIEEAGVRNIIEYNDKVDNGMEVEKMARIVIVIDELADLKMAVPEIEDHIMRLTQKARAAGMHIIIGTQRPSVDVITGVIKANIPSRIAFRVPSQVDSRTILDEIGAEKLVSRGDMLVKPVGALKPFRVQGAFISAEEIELVINFLKENATANYDEEVMQQIDSNATKLAKAEKKADGDMSEDDESDLDPKFYDALELATDMGKISSSFLQRKLGLGFQRAARIIDQMEMEGYIGEANGSKPRDVLITKDDFLELRMRNSDEE